MSFIVSHLRKISYTHFAGRFAIVGMIFVGEDYRKDSYRIGFAESSNNCFKTVRGSAVWCLPLI
jgi:hypothetical protein